jgi:hypothetical protein
VAAEAEVATTMVLVARVHVMVQMVVQVAVWDLVTLAQMYQHLLAVD